MRHLIQSLYRGLERYSPQALKQIIPRTLRVWLCYQIKIRLGQPASASVAKISALPPTMDIVPLLRLSVPTPAGYTRDELFQYLASFYHKDSGPSPELMGYLDHACDRFLYTLDLVPQQQGRLLEIGAGPYFMTLLLKKFRDSELTLVNYFGEQLGPRGVQTVVDAHGDEIDFPFDNFDVEFKTFPYPDQSFDTVLLCEVLEHFTNDPLHALLEIRRVLKDHGTLVLTTPNVLRVENVSRLLSGHNVYDLYSGYGPQGRHNREYTPEELRTLLTHAGFTVEKLFTSDVHGNPAEAFMHVDRYESLLQTSRDQLGAYIFICASANSRAEVKKPMWLYRSYPPNQLV